MKIKISLRTVSRWCDNGKVYSTKSFKYSKVQIRSVMPTSVESVPAERYLSWLEQN
jgi:hypothetical protein